jgi:hypothetical protein
VAGRGDSAAQGRDVGVSLGSYADFGWFLTPTSLKEAYFANELSCSGGGAAQRSACVGHVLARRRRRREGGRDRCRPARVMWTARRYWFSVIVSCGPPRYPVVLVVCYWNVG